MSKPPDESLPIQLTHLREQARELDRERRELHARLYEVDREIGIVGAVQESIRSLLAAEEAIEQQQADLAAARRDAQIDALRRQHGGEAGGDNLLS